MRGAIKSPYGRHKDSFHVAPSGNVLTRVRLIVLVSISISISSTTRENQNQMTTYTKPLYKRDDARRMARTMLTLRQEQGETIDANPRRMQALPMNVLAKYASRPAHYRTLTLVDARDNCVTLRLGTRY